MKLYRLLRNQTTISLGLVDEIERLEKENNKLKKELRDTEHSLYNALQSKIKYDKLLEKRMTETFNQCMGCGTDNETKDDK